MQGVFPTGFVTDDALRGLAAVAMTVFTAVLLVVPPIVWFNVRRLRIDLRADLEGLRASLDRLAAALGAVEAPAETAVADGADEEAEPPADPVDGQIGFTCPECGKFFEGPGELAGTDFACPECGVKFHIH